MREETRDFIAREILIVAALLLASLTIVLVAPLFGLGLEVRTPFLWLLFLRWVLWAGRRAAARPEQHPYLRPLEMLAAACLIVVDLLILVGGFANGGSTIAHLAVAFPVGTLAAFLLYDARRRRPRERRA